MKVQANVFYKYEKNMLAYTKSYEEKMAKQFDSPGYFMLVTSGAKGGLPKAAGGPRVGIPIQEFRGEEDHPALNILPEDTQTPYEVRAQPT